MTKKIASLLLSALLVSSCSLDRKPETTLTDSDFWKTEADLRGACNRLYVDLPGFLTGRGHDLRSEELIGTTPDDISSGSRGVPEESADWTGPYNKIGICNNIIIKGETAPIAEEKKNRWLAEARLFRAFHYFDLVRKYGDVPLILKVFTSTNDPDIKKARDPRETVIQQCYADLDYACQWLPEIEKLTNASNWGRVSRSAALGLITRIGLYEGTYIKYHNLQGGNSKNHLMRAIEAAETMIYKEGKHALYANYQNLFYFEGEGPQNKENVFVKIYGPNGESNAIAYHNQSSTKATQVSFSRQIVDNYLYTDGLPRTKSPLYKMDVKHDDIFANRDPRLRMSIFAYKEVAFKGAEYRPFDQTNHSGKGYPIKKGYMNSEFNTNGRETVDKMIIRYAEVLLSYAEALYEHNGEISDAKLNETVNAVRNRAGFTAQLTNAFVRTHQLNLLDEIRRERIVEFMDEDMHYDDIIRWKTAEKVLPQALLGILFNPDESTKSAKELNYQFTDKNGFYKGTKLYDQPNIYVGEDISGRSFDAKRDYLYPVPSYELSTSGGNITQNPHWN